MKKLLSILTLLLLLTGCGNRVNLMSGVSPENSALGLYVYDGETITRQHLFETEQIREQAMEDFRNAKAEPVEADLTALKPPFYGLEMGGSDGWSVYGLWSDGYFITGDGNVYAFDYDFEAFRERYGFEEPDEFQTLTVMPCASHVAKSVNGWNKAFLTEIEEPKMPTGVTAGLTGQTSEMITAEFLNKRDTEWHYGYDYSIQVLLDGVWYTVPAERLMPFVEVLRILPAGGSSKETFSLEPYGNLPAGSYRVFCNGLTVKFEIE